MKIIIEIASGCVSGAYYQRHPRDLNNVGYPDVFVVDLDGAAVGQSTEAVPIEVEPLEDASDITKEAMN